MGFDYFSASWALVSIGVYAVLLALAFALSAWGWKQARLARDIGEPKRDDRVVPFRGRVR